MKTDNAAEITTEQETRILANIERMRDRAIEYIEDEAEKLKKNIDMMVAQEKKMALVEIPDITDGKAYRFQQRFDVEFSQQMNLEIVTRDGRFDLPGGDMPPWYKKGTYEMTVIVKKVGK